MVNLEEVDGRSEPLVKPANLKGVNATRWYEQHPEAKRPTPRTSASSGSGRERAPRRAPKKPTKTELMQALGTGISLIQTGILLVSPEFAEDALNNREIAMLSDALADEALASERLSRWIVKAQEQSVHMKLAYVCLTIALPRLQRRGILNLEEVTGTGNTQQNPGSDAAVPVESWGAYGDRGGHGLGEEYVSGVAPVGSPIHSGAAHQTGRGVVQNGSQDTEGFNTFGRAEEQNRVSSGEQIISGT